MASSLATNVGLLGRDGFRRFGLGPWLASLLGESGVSLVRDLYRADNDPVSRALRPLFAGVALEPVYAVYSEEPRRCALDEALGEKLATLLRHPVSKPTLLRHLALASNLGVLLKVFGAGRPAGRPTLLALQGGAAPPPSSLRRHAVQSLVRSIDALDVAIARGMLEHPRSGELWTKKVPARQPAIEITGGIGGEAAARDAVRAMREHVADKKKGEVELYWPNSFAVALGKKAGLILPKDTRGGWGQHVALSPEMLEVLVLMFVGPGDPAMAWRELWRRARDQLGLVVGANPIEDAAVLEEAGVRHVELEQLERNASSLLGVSVARGVARRLPDSGAEVGGGWA